MKDVIRDCLEAALKRLQESGELKSCELENMQVSLPKNPAHGDFSTNVAMVLAKRLGMAPVELAQRLAVEVHNDDLVEHVEVAGPGFINLRLAPQHLSATIETILTAGNEFGRKQIGASRKVQVEFVSANPTGPLHIGHGRGAAYGAALAALLDCCGFEVTREYYVNDAGRQMDILAASVWLRYLEALGTAIKFPAKAYQGDYIEELATALKDDFGHRFQRAAPQIEESDEELVLDRNIEVMKRSLEAEDFLFVHQFAKDAMVNMIKTDLDAFGVGFDSWFSERSLEDSGAVAATLSRLRDAEQLYTNQGAEWFRSTSFGDEKDRVVTRENGLGTYFASDIAYHADKYARGFAEIIDVWGADHHGYIPRVRAAMTALGLDADRIDILLVQFAALQRGGKPVAMSTRSGEFVTLKELIDEIGRDAARFFYVMRRADQHLEIDIDLAVSKSNDNPVFYVQYAHARCCSVSRQLAERGLERDAQRRDLELVQNDPGGRALILSLANFPDVIEAAAMAREPHQVTNYLRDLASQFHSYYDKNKVLVEAIAEREARLAILQATQQVIRLGLGLIGVGAPERM
ncbi:MAG: arginine--tRNA ligase [Pseudomonadota bacterium]